MCFAAWEAPANQTTPPSIVRPIFFATSGLTTATPFIPWERPIPVLERPVHPLSSLPEKVIGAVTPASKFSGPKVSEERTLPFVFTALMLERYCRLEGSHDLISLVARL